MRLQWSKLASRDLDSIAEYIGQDSPAGAMRVVLEVIEQTNVILTAHPAAGRAGRILGTRELVIGSLPYLVAYRVDADRLQVLRVLHTSRRWPGDF